MNGKKEEYSIEEKAAIYSVIWDCTYSEAMAYIKWDAAFEVR